MAQIVVKRLKHLIHWFQHPPYRKLKWGGLFVSVAMLIFLSYQAAALWRGRNDPRNQAFWLWAAGDTAVREQLITVQRERCPGAPFILPTDGFIGLLYNDPRGPYSARNLRVASLSPCTGTLSLATWPSTLSTGESESIDTA